MGSRVRHIRMARCSGAVVNHELNGVTHVGRREEARLPHVLLLLLLAAANPEDHKRKDDQGQHEEQTNHKACNTSAAQPAVFTRKRIAVVPYV